MSVGDLQYLTLLAVARLGPRAVSREIRDVLAGVAGREVSVSTVFVTLTRMEDRGWLRSHPGPTPEGGGRPARVFELTDEGWSTLRTTRETAARMWDGIEPA